jgi:hypothetical protein
VANQVTIAVTVDGLPYVLATASTVSITCSDPDYPTAATLLPGALDWNGSSLSWSERVQPIDADLRYTGITVRVFDVVPASGPASGHNLLTWLATRAPALLTSTTLSASLSESETTTIHVNDTTNFDSSGFVWIEGEAIKYTSKTATTFATLTRGAYASRQVAHTIDADNALYQEVWAEMPWIARRRMILWKVGLDDVATPIWRGYLQTTPRVLDGAAFELNAQGLWDREKGLSVSDPNAEVKLRGFNLAGVAVSYGPGGDIFHAYDPVYNVYNTADELAHAIQLALYRIDTSRGTTGVTHTVSAVGGQLQWTLRSSSAVNSFGMWLRNMPPQYAATTSNGSYNVGTLSVSLPPIIAVLPSNAGVDLPVPIDSTYLLPTVWTASSSTDGGASTTSQPVLSGAYSDEIAIDLFTTQSDPRTDDDTRLIAGGPTFTGRAIDRERPGHTADPGVHAGHTSLFYQGLDRSGGLRGYLFVDRPVSFRASVHVYTDSWPAGIEHMLSDSYLSTGSDPRNWDFDNIQSVIDVIGSDVAARDMYFTGEQTIGSLVTPFCQLSGCAIGVRGSKLAIIALRRATATESVVDSISRTDIVIRSLERTSFEANASSGPSWRMALRTLRRSQATTSR